MAGIQSQVVDNVKKAEAWCDTVDLLVPFLCHSNFLAGVGQHIREVGLDGVQVVVSAVETESWSGT